MAREAFVFYRSFAEALAKVDAETKAQVLDAICAYALDEEEVELDGMAGALFVLMKPQMDRGIHFLEGQNGRHSSEYKAWRDAVFQRDDYTCQICGKKGGTLNAHHVFPYSLHPNLRYDLDNGVTLCKKCHAEVHHGKR